MELTIINKNNQLLANSREVVEYSTNINNDLDLDKWEKTDKLWFSNGIYLCLDKYLGVPPQQLECRVKEFIDRINDMTYFDRLTYRVSEVDLIDELGLSNAIIVDYDRWIESEQIDFENNDVYYLNPYENILHQIVLSDGFEVWEHKQTR